MFTAPHRFNFIMNACMITIGDELLQGYTVDTNSTWLARTLENYNIRFSEKITISDDLDAIITSTESAINKKYQYIFITGGLGPTHDDITKKAMKKVFNSEEYFDEEYYQVLIEKFKDIGLKMPENNREQAIILKECTPLKNHNGTALGMQFLQYGTQIFVLPGVPSEMQKMTKAVIIPEYLSEYEQTDSVVTLLTTGVSESKVAEEIHDLIQQYLDSVKVAFLPQYTGVNIRLRGVNKNHSPYLQNCVQEIKSRLGKLIYGTGSDTLEGVIGNLLLENHKTIAAAESCTGGLISKRMTNIPGSSKYFLGSIIAYNKYLKENLLNVSPNTLKNYGAVSEEAVTEMAHGVCKLTNADIGVAVSGISGPDGDTDEKPVGLVFIAVADENTVKVRKLYFPVKRNIHRKMSAQAALNMLRLHLLG